MPKNDNSDFPDQNTPGENLYGLSSNDNSDFPDQPGKTKNKSALEKWGDLWINQPLTHKPAEWMNKYVAEPLMKYGESGTDWTRTPSLYGGAFLSNVGEGISGLTSPLNLATVGAGSVAGKLGTGALELEKAGELAQAANKMKYAKVFGGAERALSAPQVVTGGMNIHEGLADPNGINWAKVGTGAIEQYLGIRGIRGHLPEIGNIHPPDPTGPNGQYQFPFMEHPREPVQQDLFPRTPPSEMRMPRGSEPYFYDYGPQQQELPMPFPKEPKGNEPYFYSYGNPQQLLPFPEQPQPRSTSSQVRDPYPSIVNPAPQFTTGTPPVDPRDTGVTFSTKAEMDTASPEPPNPQAAKGVPDIPSASSGKLAKKVVVVANDEVTPEYVANMTENGYEVFNKTKTHTAFRMKSNETGAIKLDFEAIRNKLASMFGREPSSEEVQREAFMQSAEDSGVGPGESTGRVAPFEGRIRPQGAPRPEDVTSPTPDPMETRQLEIEDRYQKTGRALDKYRLSDGRIVPIDATATKGVDSFTFAGKDGPLEATYVGPMDPNDVIGPDGSIAPNVTKFNQPAFMRPPDETLPPYLTGAGETSPLPPFPRDRFGNIIPGGGPSDPEVLRDILGPKYDDINDIPGPEDSMWANDISGLRQPGVLGPTDIPTDQMNKYTVTPDGRLVKSGPQPLDEWNQPTEQVQGQQQLPLGPSGELTPREMSTDYQFGRPMDESTGLTPDRQPEQLNIPEVGDAEIQDYLKNEDATPPEMKDLVTGERPPRKPWTNETGAVNLDSLSRTWQALKEGLGWGQGASKEGRQKPSEVNYLREALALPTSATTMLDLSAPGRQGLSMILTPQFWSAAGKMFKGLSLESFRAMDADLRSKDLMTPTIDAKGKIGKSFGEQIGIKLYTPASEPGPHAESIASRWLETGGNIPYFSKAYSSTVGVPIRATNRAYLTFLNHLNVNRAEFLLNSARDMAIEALTTGKARQGMMPWKTSFTPEQAMNLNPYHNLVLAKEIADFVNTATGHAPLKMHVLPFKQAEISLEGAASKLNMALFSPGLLFSRMRMLNPSTYIMASPFVRKQYLKAGLSTAAAWYAFTEMSKLAGGDQVEVSNDPTSADFGKVRIGDTRMDPGGGFLQFLVAYGRMWQGGSTSSASGEFHRFGSGYQAQTQEDMMQRFFVNKLNPVTKFGYDLLSASQYNPFHVGDRTAQMFVPLVVQDAMELAKENPNLLPWLAPVSLGMGTQTYSKGESVGKLIAPENDWLVTGGGVRDLMPWNWNEDQQ